MAGNSKIMLVLSSEDVLNLTRRWRILSVAVSVVMYNAVAKMNSRRGIENTILSKPNL